MNDTFNFSRFGKYYASDFRNTFNNVWLSVLLYSLTGVIAYFFCGAIRLFVEGSWGSYGLVGRGITFFIVFYMMIMILPSKSYGYFTAKRQGEFFSMIPVSPLEKAVTMIVNMAVIAPAVYVVIALCADALICLADPASGESLVSFISRYFAKLDFGLNQLKAEEGDLVLSVWQFFAGIVLNVLSWTLSFLIGALYFKKNKVWMTILVLILFSMAFSLIFSPIVAYLGEGFLDMVYDSDINGILNAVMWGGLAFSTVIILAMMFWVYFRVRTVKR